MNIEQKLKTSYGLFEFALEIKRKQFKDQNKNITESELHQKLIHFFYSDFSSAWYKSDNLQTVPKNQREEDLYLKSKSLKDQYNENI